MSLKITKEKRPHQKTKNISLESGKMPKNPCDFCQDSYTNIDNIQSKKQRL